MLESWFSISLDNPAGETLEAFSIRQKQAFDDQNETTVRTELQIPDYPLDCVEYVSSI